jgi:hypothetical protein
MNSGNYTAWHVRVIGGVITDVTADSTFVAVDTADIIGVAGGSHLEYTLDLDGYQGVAGYPALRFETVESCQWLNIDDLTLDQIQTNLVVMTDGATAVTATSATLNAIVSNPDNVTITAQGFEWKAATGGSYTQVAGVGTGNTFTADLTGLTPNTSYTFKAFVTCGALTIYGEEDTFMTPEAQACPAPTNLQQLIMTKEAGGIHLSWTDNAGASQWILRYRPLNGDWILVTVYNSPQYDIEGLVNGVEYEVQVRAVCDENTMSDWTEILVATATNSGIEDYLPQVVNLYPNPATEMVNVVVSDANITITGVEVYNVFGQIVETSHMASPQGRATINVSNLSDGMYYVRVTTDSGVVTKKLVKR